MPVMEAGSPLPEIEEGVEKQPQRSREKNGPKAHVGKSLMLLLIALLGIAVMSCVLYIMIDTAEMLPPEQLEIAVDRGMTFLDQTYGPGWHERINWERLNFRSPYLCLLGQLEGSYLTAVRKHSLKDGFVSAHGFAGGRQLVHTWHVKVAILRQNAYLF